MMPIRHYAQKKKTKIKKISQTAFTVRESPSVRPSDGFTENIMYHIRNGVLTRIVPGSRVFINIDY